MKSQTLLLLAFLCYSAFSTFISHHHVSSNDVLYELGTQSGTCGVRRTHHGKTIDWHFTEALPFQVCDPKAILKVRSDLWVVMQVHSGGDMLTTRNSQSGTKVEYGLNGCPFVDGSFVIAKVSTSDVQGSFGKFIRAAYMCSYDADVNYFSYFKIASVSTCDSIIQIRGEISTDSFLFDHTHNLVEVRGPNVSYLFDTEDQSFTGVEAGTEPCLNEEVIKLQVI